MESNGKLSNRELYRLPWTLPDNAISWLEPTAVCNLACDGCYRQNEKDSHKPFEEVKHELDIFQKYRNTDCVSIAGGEPLLYPHILDLVSEIKKRGIKPIINTNGKALTKGMLRDLKKAGVFGFTFHVDSKQGRSGKWAGKTEIELNELRLEYAEMLADAGNISCSFNSTIYEDTLQYIPDLVEWAGKHIDIVHTMVFIAFRYIVPNLPMDWYAGNKKVDWHKIMYHSESERRVDIMSTDMLAIVKNKFPDFQPSAYLNGTEKADHFKWLLTERVGTKKQIYGYGGPKFMELSMAGNHFLKGTYLSYGSPKLMKMGRSSMLLLSPFDKGLRKSLKNMLKNPFRIFKKAHLQSILFIQPVDFMPNGRQSMCDGCPDITVWNDELVWSCRLEEPKKYGQFLTSVPRN